MASDMESKKKHRKVLRTRFTKGANELDLLLNASEPVYSDIEVSWECLKPKHDELQTCDNDVYEGLLASAEEEELIAEMENCDAYAKRFTELRLRCMKFLDHKPEDDALSVATGNTVASTNEKVNTGKRKFKLPKIEFKHYAGDIKDWLAFWSQFKNIHEAPDIGNCDKIEYLVQATVPGSRARQLVESFPMVGENYVKIVDCMLARFGRDDLQIEVYVRELLRLVLNNAMAVQKADISVLYDQIETQLRALDTLGITSNKYAAMLFPLIESCLPQDLLRIWQRSSYNKATVSNTGSNQSLNSDSTLETRLKNLMSFLRAEVENEQRICLASEGFGLVERSNNIKLKSHDEHSKRKLSKNLLPTAAGLVNTDVAKCMFCMGSHSSDACFKAQKMTLEERKNILSDKKACFRCLKIGHRARKCRCRLRCIVCEQCHVPLMCPNLINNKQPSEDTNKQNVNDIVTDQALTNQINTHVSLQTLKVTLKGTKGTRVVRELVDSGSQRSYILKSTVLTLSLKPKRAEKVVHCLFGGTESTYNHYCYDITVIHGTYTHNFEVLDQPYICNEVSSIFYGPWMQELKGLKIDVSDSGSHGPIELLLGADVAEILYTGRRHMLQCGLVAIETYIGWTVMGKVLDPKPRSGDVVTALSLFVNPSITDLWELEVLGIQDPVLVNNEGRYDIKFPWIEGHPPLPSNYNLAKRRLETTVRKLQSTGYYEKYGKVFEEWEAEKIIEVIPEKDKETVAHYLPHRPVIKESSKTTKIRPVFDASAKEKGQPSLKDCLEKGINLIETIPDLLLSFRREKIGITADIKKAFLQISVHENDRDFLRFLWRTENGTEKIYRHRRVVFGVNCSPFILGATIGFHLKRLLETNEECSKLTTVLKLQNSFYVDNCVTSVADEQGATEATQIMTEAKFELRGWEYTGQADETDDNVPLLGLKWFKVGDTLRINEIRPISEGTITKRVILSVTQQIFDPLGFTAPTTLFPKLLLQEIWEKKTGWDEEVDANSRQSFLKWREELPFLMKIEIPKWINAGPGEAQGITLHVFCDASKVAYSAVIFLRVLVDGHVKVHLIQAKSRVSPLKKLSIPRLELLGATIAARLYSQLKRNFNEENVTPYFWCDSKTVLGWIRRSDVWSTFVWNRVQEIKLLTNAECWNHVPGEQNPADLPSRGCSPKQLYLSNWWEGPKWLYRSPDKWPKCEINYDEEEIIKDRKNSVIATMLNCEDGICLYRYFSKYDKIVRLIAWLYRFYYNVKHRDKKIGELVTEEIEFAERKLIKMVQQESFQEGDRRLATLRKMQDNDGVLLLESKIARRNDTKSFRYPYILPAQHPVVQRLIYDIHLKSGHVKGQGLLSVLRERFWILGGLRSVRSVVSKCVTCKRYDSKRYETCAPVLPPNRVRDAVAFEVTGIDMAGPVYLKEHIKAWICLFACAVYRAVHLEIVTSLSTQAFLQAFRRFVARRGRPRVVYTDNGTNFHGARNLFRGLDCNKLKEYGALQRICWYFNPPSAPWWGGWWERLIGILKTMLKKVLGNACLNLEELYTVLCDCESQINSRPLTYVSDDDSELIPLTPAMFLREVASSGMPECDLVDRVTLNRRIRYLQRLREDLRKRFRTEYLGRLQQKFKGKTSRPVHVGEVILIGNDHSKRQEWPLGRIVEVVTGKDGQIRLVRVQTTDPTWTVIEANSENLSHGKF